MFGVRRFGNPQGQSGPTYKCHICKKIHVNHILDELLETIQTEKQQVALKAILSVKEKKDIGF